MSNGDTVPTGAVTVIGVGAAGCKMLGAVQRLAADIETDATLQYVALDSNDADLHEYPPDEAVTVPLVISDEFRCEAEAFEYLDADVEQPIRGAVRQRRLGRYFLDSEANFDRVYTELETAIRDVHERATVDGTAGGHQVWLVHALGGGTGSGTLPLLAAMVDDILTGLPGETAVAGLGSLPRLDVLEDQVTVPAGNDRLYVNAYAALRELRTLLGLNEAATFPLSVPVESASESDRLATDAFELSDPPLDAYGLLGVTERSMRDSREVVNDIAAQTVLGFADRPLWNRGDRQSGVPSTSDRLFSVDGSRVEFPADTVRQYAQFTSELEDVTADIDRLEERPSDLTQTLEFLSELFLVDPRVDSPAYLPDVMEHVERLHVSPGLEQLTIERTISEYEGRFVTPEFVDAELIATYLVTKPLRQLVSEELSRHPFPDALEDVLVDTPYAEREVGNASPDEVIQYWNSEVKPSLAGRIEGLEKSLGEASLFQVLERSRLESALEEYRSEYGRLERLHAEYRRLRELDEWIVDEHLDAEMRLHERRDELEDRFAKAEDRLDRLRSKRTRLEQKRETLRDRLSSTDTTPYLTRLPVTDVETAARTVESTGVEGLSAFVERGVLGAEPFEGALEAALSRLTEPVEDRAGSHRPREEVLAVQGTDRDTDLSVDTSRFDEVISQRSTDQYAVRFTALFGSIDLEATSEFGTIDEWFSDPDRDVSAQLGRGVSDDTVVRSFAYPELLPDSLAVRE